jgi:hypothetical protein
MAGINHSSLLSIGNETETMFKSVPKEEMNISMSEANISMSGYVS